MPRKHYRAVQKQIEQAPSKGIFIPNKQKPRLYILAAAIGAVIFLKGLLLGYLAGRGND